MKKKLFKASNAQLRFAYLLAFFLSATTVSPVASGEVTVSGTFSDPIGEVDLIVTGLGTSFFTYGTPQPTTLNFVGSSRSGQLPSGSFTLGSLEMFNGAIFSGTGATSVNLNVSADDGTTQVSGTAIIEFINRPNVPDPLEASDSFCLQFDGQTKCAWVLEGESAVFDLVGQVGSLNFVDLLPTSVGSGFVTIGTDPTTNPLFPAEIVIKPDDEPNSINVESGQNIAVAVLSTDTFDATELDVTATFFGPGQSGETHGMVHIEDVDGDGDNDAILHFSALETGLACGDTLATLVSTTFSNLAITGSDSVSIVPCNK